MKRFTWLALVLSTSLLSGCTREQLGLPRIALMADSPDGGAKALVRNRPSIDPPEQSLWLVESGKETKLRNLGSDSDWCNRIVWSADGSTVAFLVQDARLITVDRASRRILSETWLTEWKGEYPPARFVMGLALSDDGKQVVYRDCARPGRQGFEAPDQGAPLGDCVARRTRTAPSADDWRNPFD